jgi:putative salt-induced outer membrane protein YdiY
VRSDYFASMIESPNSTLLSSKTWFVWLLVASWFLALPGSTELMADDDELLEPTWRRGLSQWTGSGYELPFEFPEPRLSDTPSDPLPYTMPVDPTDQTVAKRRTLLPGIHREFGPTLAAPQQMRNRGGDKPSYSAPWSAALTKEWESTDKSSPQQTTTDGIPALPPPARRPAPGLVQPVPPPASRRSFSDRISRSNPTAESPPLQSQVIRWYQHPRRWIRGWDSNAAIGVNGSEGNANTLAIQTGLEMRRKGELSMVFIDVDYRQATNRDVTVEDYGRLNVDFDRKFRDSKWSLFGKYGMTWDRFKAFDLRLWVNGGSGYHWIRTENASLITHFGGGAMREIASPDDSWVPEAVFGFDAERQLTPRQKIRAKFDYFPAWEKFSDFRLVGDLAWEMLLDGTKNLSIRLSATDRYDSTPNGAKPHDVYYSSLLLYKF